MKILIRKDKLTGYWKLRFGSYQNYYQSHDACVLEANKRWKRYYKESAAFSMVSSLSQNLLNIDELAIVKKLIRNKCKGITKAQYGYLKGIHERQEREW